MCDEAAGSARAASVVDPVDRRKRIAQTPRATATDV
jgi:hypothetical protein